MNLKTGAYEFAQTENFNPKCNHCNKGLQNLLAAMTAPEKHINLKGTHGDGPVMTRLYQNGIPQSYLVNTYSHECEGCAAKNEWLGSLAQGVAKAMGDWRDHQLYSVAEYRNIIEGYPGWEVGFTTPEEVDSLRDLVRETDAMGDGLCFQTVNDPFQDYGFSAPSLYYSATLENCDGDIARCVLHLHGENEVSFNIVHAKFYLESVYVTRILSDGWFSQFVQLSDEDWEHADTNSFSIDVTVPGEEGDVTSFYWGFHSYAASQLEHVDSKEAEISIQIHDHDAVHKMHTGKTWLHINLPAGEYTMNVSVNWHRCCHHDLNVVTYTEEEIQFQTNHGKRSAPIDMSCADEEAGAGEPSLPSREIHGLEAELNAIIDECVAAIDDANNGLDAADRLWGKAKRAEKIGKIIANLRNLFAAWKGREAKKNKATIELCQKWINQVSIFYRSCISDILKVYNRTKYASKTAHITKLRTVTKTVTTRTVKCTTTFRRVFMKMIVRRFKIGVMSIKTAYELSVKEYQAIKELIFGGLEAMGVDIKEAKMAEALKQKWIRGEFRNTASAWEWWRKWAAGEDKIIKWRFKWFNARIVSWMTQVRKVFRVAMRQLNDKGLSGKADELHAIIESFNESIFRQVIKKFFRRCRKALGIVIKVQWTFAQVTHLHNLCKTRWATLRANWETMRGMLPHCEELTEAWWNEHMKKHEDAQEAIFTKWFSGEIGRIHIAEYRRGFHAFYKLPIGVWRSVIKQLRTLAKHNDVRIVHNMIIAWRAEWKIITGLWDHHLKFSIFSQEHTTMKQITNVFKRGLTLKARFAELRLKFISECSLEASWEWGTEAHIVAFAAKFWKNVENWHLDTFVQKW